MSSQINGVELLMINDDIKSQNVMMDTCSIVGLYYCIIIIYLMTMMEM